MKIYLVEGHCDPRSSSLGVFAEPQTAIEFASLKSKNYEFGCTVHEIEVFQGSLNSFEQFPDWKLIYHAENPFC